MGDPLAELAATGVAVWLDDLSRARLATGSLAALVRDRHVVGVTTNPTIFQQAISGSDHYDGQIRDLAVRGVEAAEALRMITAFDVRWACDVLRPVYDASDGVDGRVSIEVDPRLAHEPEATVAEARQLWWLVDRPNLFVKIPGDEGRPPGHRAVPGRGHQRQRHAHLLPPALRRGDGCLRRGHAAGPRRRPRPDPARLGRLVLRQPRRRRDRPAPGRHRLRRGEGGAGRGRDRERAAGVPAARGGLRLRPLARARRGGGPAAAAAVGLHRCEGPGLSGHPLRRRARHRRRGEHDARSDAEGGGRPRRRPRRHGPRRLRRRGRG